MSSSPVSLRSSAPLSAKERSRTVESALCFFGLLASYYVLRPVREEMGIRGGVHQLQWMYTATFASIVVVVPGLTWLVSRLRRGVAVPIAYALSVITLLGFSVLLARVGPSAQIILARVLYVWVSVFNMLAISLFWALMADLFTVVQSKRCFGLIAAGGSAGAIVGPGLAGGLAGVLSPAWLVLLAAIILALTAVGVARLARFVADPHDPKRHAAAVLGGHWWEGVTLLARSPQLLGLSGYIIMHTAISTFLYFEQANIVATAIDDGGVRTQLFAAMDLAVNLLALALQSLATAGLVRRYGVGWLLLSLPVISALGFVALAVAPIVGVLVSVQVLRRAFNFALAKPAREILFTGVSAAERYKSKLVIDTVIYRGGDAISAWAFTGLAGLGLGLGGIAAVGVPLAAVWGAVARFLGQRAAVASRSDATDLDPTSRGQ